MSIHDIPAYLALRGTFLLPELEEQGMQKRVGEGHLTDAIPLDNDHILIHTDTTVSLRSIRTQETLWEIDCPSFQWAFTRHQSLLALSPDSTQILLWDLHTGHIVHRLHCEFNEEEEFNLVSMEFSPDGQMLAVGTRKNERSTIILWETMTGKCSHILSLEDESDITTIAFHPSQSFLAIGSFDDYKVWFWRLQDETVYKTWDLHASSGCNDRVHTLEFNHDGTMLFASNGRCGLRVWDCEQEHEVALSSSIHPIWMSIDPTNRFLAVTHFENRQDQKIQLLELATWRLMYEIAGMMPHPTFSPDGQFLAVLEETKGLVVLRKTITGQEVGRIHLNPYLSGSIDLIPSGRFLVSGPSNDGSCLLWNMQNASVKQIFSKRMR